MLSRYPPRVSSRVLGAILFAGFRLDVTRQSCRASQSGHMTHCRHSRTDDFVRVYYN